MSDLLKQLIKLQRTDVEINELQLSLKEIPAKLAAEKNKFEEVKAEFEKKKAELNALQREHHQLEVDLASDEEQKKKFSSQIYSVKTNEQYKALLHEIALLKDKISKTEDKILQIMEKIEQTNVELEEKKKEVAEAEKKLKEQENFLRLEEERLNKLLEEKQEIRKKIAAEIDETSLAIYQKLWNRYKNKGLAVVPIKGEVCGGCFLSLPPQVVVDIKTNKKLIQCENCSRILYYTCEET